MAKPDKKEITVVAEYTAASPEASFSIKTHDKAWHAVLDLPTPATLTFERWARID